MAQRIKPNLKQLCSLGSFVHCSLVVFVSVVLLSELAVAASRRNEVQTAQQPTATNSDANRAAAEQLEREGLQLYKQGTASSLQQAIEKWKEALPLERAVGDKAGEVVILNHIGLVYEALGDKQQALSYLKQALQLARAVGNRAGEANTLNNIGSVYEALGDRQQALSYYKQALQLVRTVDYRAGEAGILSSIGVVYDDLGDRQQALSYYKQALQLAPAVGDRTGEGVILRNIAIFERERGNLNSALTQIEAAIKIIEQLRTKIVSPELRTSFFASIQDYYKLKIDILMQLHKQQPSKGYDAIALQASESARARALLDLLNEANANIRSGVDPKLLEQERSLQQREEALEKRRLQALRGNHTPQQQQALVAQFEQEYAALNAQYQEVETQIRATSPRYAALTQPQPLTLPQIQQQILDRNTLLLEYSLGRERSYLWVVTQTGITSYELPKQADVEATAQNFRALLNNPAYRLEIRGRRDNRGGIAVQPSTDSTEVVTKLSQMLLGPVTGLLGQKRLLIVGDGALQYIPFEALPIPSQTKTTNLASSATATPLIVEHEIVNLPSASTLAIIRRDTSGRAPAPKTVAVFADPVFSSDDSRVHQTVTSEKKQTSNSSAFKSDTSLAMPVLHRAARESNVKFNRLTYSRQEAQDILQLLPANASKQAFEDFAASRATATSPELAQYRFVHFATHGLLDSKNPELSGVVLSLVDEKGNPENGFLRLHDIFNLNLPAELVVLSGCNTGLGQEVKGEGLVGLTRGFIYAGTRRVVASLWSVDDEATGELMKRFYEGMLKQGLTPAAALRAAQLDMQKQGQWTSPYYWAGFVLQGEWK